MALGRGILVERRADARGAAEIGDQPLHRVGRQLFAVLGAGGTGDRLVHQGAAQVVGAGVQAIFGALDAHLHPRDLDVRDQRMQREAADRMHQHGFAEGRSHARRALQRDRRLGGDEGQRHQLGEAAGILLQVAQAQQMACPVLHLVDMAEHDGGRRAQADLVGGAHDVEPLVGRDLVGAEDVAHFVVEHLGGRAGQAAQAGIAQLCKIVGDRQAERRGAMPDLERREGVDMHAWDRLAHGGADVEIMLAGVLRVDTALHADFGGAAVPGFARATHDFLDREVVG